jgi:phytoene dehydrogenase-like protein
VRTPVAGRGPVEGPQGMTPAYDAAIVGAGHNGLVCAAYLGRAGLRVVVLERRERPGGCLAEEGIDGARVPALAHTVGGLRRSVVRDLGLHRHGVAWIEPEVRVFAPQPDGRAVTLWVDPRRTAEELHSWSRRDGETWPRFDRKVRAMASFMAYLSAMTPPDLRAPSLADALGGLRLARALGGLGGPAHRREAIRVLPMAVADFVGDHLEADPVRAAVAARGIQYTAMGPRSAGTTAVLLADSVGGTGASGQAKFVRGGPGALARALADAVTASGGELRCGSEVAAVTSREDRVTGVALASGEEVTARAVVSGLDPKRTLLSLCDPVAIGPTLGWRAGNIRQPGTVAKVNLVLDSLPEFPAARGEVERLQGRILVATGVDDLERAFDASKYGRISESPYLEATIPTLLDPSLAPGGKHVLSVVAQWTPYALREGDWDARREEVGDVVLRSLEACAPGISHRVSSREVLTPLDLEREYGLTGGHPLHAEPGLDQFFAWRPMLGHARYRIGIRGLFLCGSGAHPGGGVTGAPGANAAREVLKELRGR